MPDPENQADIIRENMAKAIAYIPWAKETGFELCSFTKDRVSGKINWRESLIGDPETGVIHGGAITSLLDSLAGMAVIAALNTFKSTATLDLRIDYMRPARKGLTIYGEAECYHMTRTIAFIRGRAYHEEDDKTIATATGTFALNRIENWSTGKHVADNPQSASAKSEKAPSDD